MVKKWKKIASLLFVCSTLVVGTTTSIIWGTKVQERNKTLNTELTNQIEKSDNLYNGALNFNGKNYENPDSATIDYLKKNPINQKRYIGDIESSYINRDDHLINVNSNNIREYDSSKLSEAYKDATNENGYTDDYQDAFNSEVPIYQKITRFDDYSGDDLNKLPIDSFEAQKNLKKNVSKPHSIPYYLIEDSKGNKHKINPLNAKDINNLKKIAINEVAYGKQNNSPFGIEEYYFENDDKTLKNVNTIKKANESIDSSIFNSFKNFIDRIELKPSITFETKYSHLWYSYENSYSFTFEGNKNSKNNVLEGKYIKPFILDKNKNKIKVSDEAYASNFLYWVFSKRKNLGNAIKVDDYKYQKFYAAVNWSTGGYMELMDNIHGPEKDESDKYQKLIRDIFSNGKKFKIENTKNVHFYKESTSWSWGDYIFFRIMDDVPKLKYNPWIMWEPNEKIESNDMRGVYFKFDTKMRLLDSKNKNLWKDINQNDDELLKNEYFKEMGISNNNLDTSNSNFIKFKNDLIMNSLNLSDKSDENNIFYENNKNKIEEYYLNNVKEIYEKTINPNFVKNAIGISYSDKSGKQNIFKDLNKDVGEINGEIDKKFMLDINYKNNAFYKNIKSDYKKIITFNEKPLFLLNDDNKNIADYLSNLDKVVNVSNNLVNFTSNNKNLLEPNKNNYIYIDKNKYTIDFNSWEKTINNQLSKSKIEENAENIDKKNLLTGLLSSNNGNQENEITQGSYKPGIFSSLYYYQKNLEFFSNENSKYNHLLKNISNRIDKKINDDGSYLETNPNESFVILYNKSEWTQTNDVNNIFINQLYQMHYGEYYGRLTDFNDSFLVIKMFYNNTVDQVQQLNNFNSLIPSKLNYYVDKKGKVISIDPIKDSVNLSSYPTQSMYDSSKLVDFNLSNNLIIKHDTTKVFYNDNGKNILLKNNIEFLYSLSINKKEYVFDQYNYAFKYLKSYIISNSKKI